MLCTWTDYYKGTPDALIAAGLLKEHEIPGMPGNGISMTSFRADGSRVPKGNSWACREKGYRKVRTISRTKLCVEVSVGEDVVNERRRAIREEQARRRRLETCWPFPIVGNTFMGEPLGSQGMQA